MHGVLRAEVMMEESDDEDAPGPAMAGGEGEGPSPSLQVEGLPAEVTTDMLTALFQQCVPSFHFSHALLRLDEPADPARAPLFQVPRPRYDPPQPRLARCRAQERQRARPVRERGAGDRRQGRARRLPRRPRRADPGALRRERVRLDVLSLSSVQRWVRGGRAKCMNSCVLSRCRALSTSSAREAEARELRLLA